MTVTELHNPISDDDRAFEAFFQERYRPMLALAISMVDQRCAAEEVVQDALQQVWLRWEDLTDPACYLRAAVTNRCHDELRKRRVRRDNDPKLLLRPSAEPHYLADVLADVTPKRREALVLRYYGGHSLAEVAAVMEIPTGTAKSLIHRGLADIRGALN